MANKTLKAASKAVSLFNMRRRQKSHASFLAILLSVFFFLQAHLAQAEPFNDHTVFDHYEVHYSVFNSTFVPANIAANYGIKRSAYESLLNVSVSPRGKYGALPSKLTGTITNLLQQQKTLEFIEIAEKDATYYIAPLRIAGEETVHISLDIKPEGSEDVLNVKFSRKLYSDK